MDEAGQRMGGLSRPHNGSTSHTSAGGGGTEVVRNGSLHAHNSFPRFVCADCSDGTALSRQ